MIEVAAPCANLLGEAAAWDTARQRLLWVDMMQPMLFRLQPETGAVTKVPLALSAPLGPVIPTDRPGELLVSDRTGLHRLDEASGALTPLLHPEQGRPDLLVNDGKVDRWGRLWIGTSDAAETVPRGALWCIAPGQAPVLADAGFAVSNGPAFSPDGTTLYFSNSVAGQILAYTVSRHTAWPQGRRVFAIMAPGEGLPDGLTVDAEGCLWVAHWDGARVTRFAPDGTRIGAIAVPAPRVTSVAFGGRDLGTLYITTARIDLGPEILDLAPGSGHLFAVDAGVAGLAELPFVVSGEHTLTSSP